MWPSSSNTLSNKIKIESTVLCHNTHSIWSVELKAIQAQKEALIEEAANASTTISAPKIGCPRQGVGIQEGMGLSDDKHKYDTIRVCPHMGLAIRM